VGWVPIAIPDYIKVYRRCKDRTHVVLKVH
jgi:hypothetical protein